MVKYHNILLFIVFILSGSAYSYSNSDTFNYWKCTTQDQEKKQWASTNNYKKIALNVAVDKCKKESRAPSTCTLSKTTCVQFHNGVNTTPLWECTALDDNAEPWVNNPNPQKEDAALAAKSYCQENSKLPDTCYINLITCININNEEG